MLYYGTFYVDLCYYCMALSQSRDMAGLGGQKGQAGCEDNNPVGLGRLMGYTRTLGLYGAGCKGDNRL